MPGLVKSTPVTLLQTMISRSPNQNHYVFLYEISIPLHHCRNHYRVTDTGAAASKPREVLSLSSSSYRMLQSVSLQYIVVLPFDEVFAHCTTKECPSLHDNGRQADCTNLNVRYGKFETLPCFHVLSLWCVRGNRPGTNACILRPREGQSALRQRVEIQRFFSSSNAKLQLRCSVLLCPITADERVDERNKTKGYQTD